MSLSPRHGCLGLLLVLLVTFAVYAPSLGNGYAMDDRIVAMGIQDPAQGEAKRNEMIWDLLPVGRYFGAHYWKGSVEEDTLYRPVTVYSYALVHQIARPAEPDFADNDQLATAFPQHLVNILCHLLAVIMVYVLVRQLKVGVGPALAAAAVFGLHAVHSETVAGIVGRAEIFGFLFGAIGTSLLFSVEQRAVAVRVLVMPLAALCFFLAFGSKEVAVGWVGFLAVYGVAYRWRTREEEKWAAGAAIAYARHLIVAAVPLAIFLYLRHQVVGDFKNLDPIAWIVNPIADASTGQRVLTAIFVWGWKGLGLTLAPFNLSGNYGASALPIITSALDPRFLGMVAVLLMVLITALVTARRHPLIFVGVCTFFGFSFIISNIPFAIGTMFAERLYYTPSVVLAFFAAWLFERAGGRPSARMAVGIVMAVWLGASSLVILQRNPVWENDDVFFTHEARNQPNSVRMRLCAAGIHTDQSPPERTAALSHLWAAAKIDPEYALAWNNLAAIYLDTGNLGLAEQCVLTGLEAKHTIESSDLHKLSLNYALILKALGRRAEAWEAMKRALLSRPKFERTWTEVMLLAKEDVEKKVPGAYERVAAVIDEGAKQDPAKAEWPFLRGLLFFTLGKPAEAIAEYRQALALDRGHIASRIQLVAMLQVKAENDAETTRFADEGDEVNAMMPQWAYARAIVTGRAGRLDEATRELVEALGRSPEFGPAWSDLQNLAAAEGGLPHALAALEAKAVGRPTSPVWPYFHGVLLARSGKLPEGMDRMGDALAIKPSFVQAWRDLLAMSESGGGPAKVLEVVTRAGDGPTRGAREWPYYSGVAMNATGQTNVAATRFAEAIRRDPTFVDARLELLGATYDAYPPAAVRAMIRGGLATDPMNPNWPLYRGLLLHREGKYREALPEFEKALSGLPGHPQARFTVAECLIAVKDTANAAKVLQALVDDEQAPPTYREKAKAALGQLGR